MAELEAGPEFAPGELRVVHPRIDRARGSGRQKRCRVGDLGPFGQHAEHLLRQLQGRISDQRERPVLSGVVRGDEPPAVGRQIRIDRLGEVGSVHDDGVQAISGARGDELRATG